ncbi:hypothetical protein WJW27_002607 [Escherichia coli]|uniref:hypothetical protein n=1 Tax=Escherichia coli TaxID=562 RepID=UPI0023776E63|nr:hypothetical protein vBEcoMphAPEC6_01830 [Escherichia phage ph0011]
MFDFSDIKNKSVDDDNKPTQHSFSIAEFLKHIDRADYKFYNELTEKEQKEFTPYTVLRWVSSLDDSLQVTYPSSKVESVFGKWKAGGKEALTELVTELKASGTKVSSVTKYCHGDYDWRIKFAVQSKDDAHKLISSMMEFGVSGSEIISLVDTEVVKYQLIMLNDMVNDGFWDMKEHPELVYQLMCSVHDMIGAQEMPRNWLNFSKNFKKANNELFDLIKNSQPDTIATQMNEDEYKIVLLQYDKKTFETFLDNNGFQDNEKKSMMKLFKEECKKYGKEIK